MHFLRHILRLLLFTLLGFGITLGLAYYTLQTSWAKRHISAILSEQYGIEITGLSGSLPFSPAFETLQVADTQGVWLTLKHASIDWELKLFPLTWRIHSISTEEVHVQRLPAQEKGRAPESVKIPRVVVEHLSLPSVMLEPNVTGRRQVLAAEGNIRSFYEHGTPATHLQVRTLEGPETALELAIEHNNDEMLLEASLTEAAGGIIGKALGIPGPLSVQLAGSGPLYAWNGKGSVSAGDNTVLEASVTSQEDNGQLSLHTQATFHFPDAPPFQALRQRIGSEAALTSHMQLQPEGVIHLQETVFTAKGLNLSAQGTVGEQYDLQLHARVDTSTPLLPQNAGAWEGEITIAGPADALEYAFEATGKEIKTLPELIGGVARLTGQGKWQDSRLTMHDMRLEATHASISADMEIDARTNTLTMQGSATLPDVSHLQEHLRGSMEAQMELSGSIAAPEGKLSITLQKQNHTFRLTSPLRYRNDTLAFPHITGGTDKLSLEGALTYLTATGLMDGALQIHAQDFSALSPFLDVTLAGSGEITAAFSPQRGKQALNVSAQGKSLAIDKTLVDEASLQANGVSDHLQFTVHAESAGAYPYTITTEGALLLTANKQVIHLRQAEGKVKRFPFTLAAPASIEWERGLRVNDLRLGGIGGSLGVDGSASPSAADMKISMRNLPASLLAEESLEGMVNGNIIITGSGTKPTATFGLRADDIARTHHREGKATFLIQGKVAHNALSTRVETVQPAKGLDAELTVPAQFSLVPFHFSLPPEGMVRGQIRMDGEVAPFINPFLPPEHTLRGYASGTLDIKGTRSAPYATGVIELSKGRYMNGATGTTLENIALTLQAFQDRLEIPQAYADAGKGMVRASGNISLAAPYPLSMKAAFRDATLLHSREASGAVNGDVTLGGDIASPLLAGNIILGPMEITLPARREEEGAEIHVLNPEALPQQVWQQTEEARTRWPEQIRLGLDISAPGQVFVRGRGLETEMRGDLRINGTLATPEIEGSLRSVRGTYTLLDRTLAIREGVLTFRGVMPPSPFIHLIAATEAANISAVITIEGPIRLPTLALTSVPSLPQDEILAYLLFGRELRSITPFQGIQLAQALHTLRGKGETGRLDFLGQARNLLGVDKLSVEETDSGDIGVGAGRYISDKIYLGVEGAAEPEAGKVTVEVEVSPRFSVETETGGRASGARFNWKYDY